MARFEIGVTLPVMEYGPERTTPRWPEIRQVAVEAEQAGFDTLWIPDELLWRPAEAPARGFWDGVSIAGAAAAVTSKIKIGSWVMSALHRNPGIIAKTAETLDEIAQGRFVFGLGSGHAGGQAHSFGLPEEKVMGRFEEALQVIVPLMRGGHADFEGTFHSAHDLIQQPVGPRPNRIPLLIGAQRPRALRLAAQYADIWSTYAEESSTLDELGPRLESFVAICEEIGQDPAQIGRAAGLEVNPLEKEDKASGEIRGSTEQIADRLRAFREAGFTQADLMVFPGTRKAYAALVPVLELLRADGS